MAKYLKEYLELWSKYLSTAGNPLIELTRMEEFVDFLRAGMQKLAGTAGPTSLTESQQQVIVDFGLFLNQLGSFERWRALDRKYRDEIARLEQRLAESETARRESEAALKAAQSENEKLRHENARLRERLAAQEAAVTSAANTASAASLAEQEALQRELQKAQKLADEASARSAALQAERDAAIARAGTAETRASEAAARIAELEARIEALKLEVESGGAELRAKLEAAEAELVSQRAELDRLRAAKADWDRERERLLAELENLRQQLAQLELAVADLRNKLKDKSKQIAFLKAQVAKFEHLASGGDAEWSPADFEDVKDEALDGATIDRAAQILSIAWGLPDSLGTFTDPPGLSGLARLVDALTQPFGSADSRAALFEEANAMYESLRRGYEAFLSLRTRPVEEHPYTADELRRLLDGQAALAAWAQAAPFATTVVAAAHRALDG